MKTLLQAIEDELLNGDLKQMLRDYKRTKKELKKIHTRIINLVSEDFAISKKDCKEIDIISIAEFYLKTGKYKNVTT